MKGLPIAAIPQGHNVQIWFSSPTGDTSDSFQLNIPCHNADQARGLAAEYGKFMKGIYPVYEISETTQKVISDLQQEVRELRNWEEAHIHEISELKERLDMYKLAYDSQRLIIQNLKEQLKASEDWFDQTVGIK